MNDQRYRWRVKHKPGEKNKFSDHFVLWKYTWRLALVTDLRKYEETNGEKDAEGGGHVVFLEYFGSLPFDVFTRYTLHVVYADDDEETHRAEFSFDEYQSDFGTVIKSKETKKVSVEIEMAARNYEMKKTTPYAGMINLGSTCYINSFMQTLFHIRGFDRELFKQPPANKTLEMQRLFFQLKQGHHYIDTLSFVKAFKLKESIEYQQDIQEFAKYLLDELEKEAKGTPFFKYIEDTFYGEMACLLECAKGCRKEKTEKYNDIQLVISSLYSSESHGTLEEALSAYTTTTRLEHPNQYACSEHGYVDAEKKDYFKTFPPVLFFQIKRFGMDYETGETYKLNDRFSFPDEIDLEPFMHPHVSSVTPNAIESGREDSNRKTDEQKKQKEKQTSEQQAETNQDETTENGSHQEKEKEEHYQETRDEKKPHEYSLYSVNVHLGDGNTEGHYYAYIKKGNMWYKFNDCYVTPSSHQEAVEGTFGGRHIYKNKQNIANAYLLVYVRKSQMDSLFSEAPIEVPEETREVIQGASRMQQLVLHAPATLCGYWGLGPFDVSTVVPCAVSGCGDVQVPEHVPVQDQNDQEFSGTPDFPMGDNGKEMEENKQLAHTDLQSRLFAFAEAYRPCSAPVARYYALQVDSRTQPLLSARSIREKGRSMLGRKKGVIFFVVSAGPEGNVQVVDITSELNVAVRTDSELPLLEALKSPEERTGSAKNRSRTLHVIVVPSEEKEGQSVPDYSKGNNTGKQPDKSESRNFLLFFKAHKVMGQPLGLGAFCPVESLEVVSPDELVDSWIQKKGLERDTVFAEKSGNPCEIPDDVSFEQLFQTTHGVLVAHAGLGVLEAYFRDLQTHQVVCVLTDFGVLRFWMGKEWTRDSLKEILAEKVHGTAFSLSPCPSHSMLVLEPSKGFGMVRYRYLGSATANPNKEITENSGVLDVLEDCDEEQQEAAVFCVLKQPFRVKEVLQILAPEHKKRAKREKVKVVETVSGDSVLRIFSTDRSFDLRKGALITLQSVSTRRHVEAFVKIGRQIAGHPFLVEIEPPTTPEELRVNYRLQNSVLFVEKENGVEVQLEEGQTLPKECLKCKLVFRVPQ